MCKDGLTGPVNCLCKEQEVRWPGAKESVWPLEAGKQGNIWFPGNSREKHSLPTLCF